MSNAKDTTDKLNIYIDEYNLVVNKITSLSLKFSSGSYIIPISLIVAIASINFEVTYANLLAVALPVVLCLYAYNHIRYMALQFRLSGYAKHLERQINSLSGDEILLWENSIARSNHQGIFETIFFGVSYIIVFVVIYYAAYVGLYNSIRGINMPYFIASSIAFVYFWLLCAVVFLLIFFSANEHNKTFKIVESITNFNKKEVQTETVAHEVDTLQQSSRDIEINSQEEQKTPHGTSHLALNDIATESSTEIDETQKHEPPTPTKATVQASETSKKRSYRPRCLIMVFSVFLMLCISLTSLCPLIHLFSYGTVDTLDDYDFVIVLGNKSEGQPSEIMLERLDCLIDHITDNSHFTIVLSGGKGEAELMQSYLLDNGVTSLPIILENYSTDTYYNFLYTKHLISGKAVVITSDYHIFRSQLLCDKLELKCDFLSATSNRFLFFKEIKESMICLFEFFKPSKTIIESVST